MRIPGLRRAAQEKLAQPPSAVKRQPNHAKRLECAVSRRFLFEPPRHRWIAPGDGALQTLRDLRRLPESSRNANLKILCAFSTLRLCVKLVLIEFAWTNNRQIITANF